MFIENGRFLGSSLRLPLVLLPTPRMQAQSATFEKQSFTSVASMVPCNLDIRLRPPKWQAHVSVLSAGDTVLTRGWEVQIASLSWSQH